MAVKVCFRIADEQYKRLTELAQKEGCLTVSEFIRKVLNEKLKG